MLTMIAVFGAIIGFIALVLIMCTKPEWFAKGAKGLWRIMTRRGKSVAKAAPQHEVQAKATPQPEAQPKSEKADDVSERIKKAGEHIQGV